MESYTVKFRIRNPQGFTETIEEVVHLPKKNQHEMAEREILKRRKDVLSIISVKFH